MRIYAKNDLPITNTKENFYEKILAFLLVLTMLFGCLSFTSCGSSDDEEENKAYPIPSSVSMKIYFCDEYKNIYFGSVDSYNFAAVKQRKYEISNTTYIGYSLAEVLDVLGSIHIPDDMTEIKIISPDKSEYGYYLTSFENAIIVIGCEIDGEFVVSTEAPQFIPDYTNDNPNAFGPVKYIVINPAS